MKNGRDPHLDEVLHHIRDLTAREVSDLSNNLIGRSTIYNWRSGKTRRPIHYTMTAALHSAGFSFRIVKDRLK